MINLDPIKFQAGIRLRRLCFDPQTDPNPFSMENVTHPIIFFNDQAEDANQFLYKPEEFCKALSIIAEKAKRIQFLTLRRTRCSENILSNGFRPFFEKIEPNLEAILFLHEPGWEKKHLVNSSQENLMAEVFKKLRPIEFSNEGSWTLYIRSDLKLSFRNYLNCLENFEFLPHFLPNFDEITKYLNIQKCLDKFGFYPHFLDDFEQGIVTLPSIEELNKRR